MSDKQNRGFRTGFGAGCGFIVALIVIPILLVATCVVGAGTCVSVTTTPKTRTERDRAPGQTPQPGATPRTGKARTRPSPLRQVRGTIPESGDVYFTFFTIIAESGQKETYHYAGIRTQDFSQDVPEAGKTQTEELRADGFAAHTWEGLTRARANYFLQELLRGEKVSVEEERVAGKTRYAYVWVQHDGQDLLVNGELVRAGFAVVNEDAGKAYIARLRRADEKARAEARGIWGAQRPQDVSSTAAYRLGTEAAEEEVVRHAEAAGAAAERRRQEEARARELERRRAEAARRRALVQAARKREVEAAQPIRVSDLTYNVVERNDIWWKFAYKMTVTNKTDRDLRISVRIKFYDSAGLLLDDATQYGNVAARQSWLISENALIDTGIARRVTSAEAEVSGF